MMLPPLVPDELDWTGPEIKEILEAMQRTAKAADGAAKAFVDFARAAKAIERELILDQS